MSYYVGQTVELSFTTTPAEPGTLTVTRPDGTSAPAVLSGADGAQTALLEADQAGTWRYVWEAPNAGQRPGSFTVGVPLVTLDEAKRVAPQAPGQTAEDWEADLAGVVSAVCDHLSRHYGAPMPGPVTRVYRSSFGGPAILPLGVTVLSVQSGSVTATGWSHDPDSGLLHGLGWYDSTVTYDVPVLPDVREAALYTIQHAWETRTGANPVPFQSGIDETYTASRGFFVPNRAKELLMPYGTRVA